MARKELDSQKETFRFTAMDAMSVLLVGDFTHWQAQPIPMRKGSDGVWKATVDLTPGTHTYRFIVDGEWHDDPECTIHVANPFGGQDMVRSVPRTAA
jgi:1,4-alpha-glucan branching enzyme